MTRRIITRTKAIIIYLRQNLKLEDRNEENSDINAQANFADIELRIFDTREQANDFLAKYREEHPLYK